VSRGSPASPGAGDAGRLVWDLPVRITHWLLVLAVSGSWLTSRLDSSYFTWHEYCGYTVLVLASFRILWGFVGTRHALFREFVRGPQSMLEYLATLRGGRAAPGGPPSVGHNPLGAVSVVLLLAALLGQACTGLFANDDIDNAGPFYGWVSASLSNALTRWHHLIFDALELLIAVHLAAIAFYAVVRRENLVLPMIHGRKPAALVPADRAVGGSRLLLAAALVALLIAGLVVAIRRAPAVSMSIF
jgi:cytochrome b